MHMSKKLLGCLVLAAPIAIASAQQAQQSTDFVSVLQRNLKAWDKDRNNQLSPLEIDAALADPKLSGDDAAAAGTIKCLARDNLYRIRRIDIATINDDIRIVQSRKPSDYFSDDWFVPDWNAAFEIARKRAASTNTPYQPPDLATLKVDDYGSEAFVAVLGGLMNSDPQFAAALLNPLPDGKVQVVTPLWKKPFGPITPAQTASVSTTGNVWARSIESGIDALNRERFPQAAFDGRVANFSDRFAVAQSYIVLLNGKQSKVNTFRASTGVRKQDGWEYTPQGTPDGLAATASQIIAQTLKKKQMAIALTHGSAIIPANAKGPAKQGPLPKGINPYSYFAILAIDPKAKTITLWNPSGANFTPAGAPSAVEGYPTANGKWTMPLNDFTYVFSGYVVEGDNKATLPGQSRGR